MNLKNTPIRTLSVPHEWLAVEGTTSQRVDELAVLEVYRLLREGKDPWQTRYAVYVLRDFKAQKVSNPEAELAKRFDSFRELLSKPSNPEPLPAQLLANGRFSLFDGHHRACRWVMDGHKKIPIAVQLVSPTWQRAEALMHAVYGEKKIYHAIDHPWFDGWKVGRSSERFETIARVLTEKGVKGVNAVDIGSCCGSLARAYAAMGFATFAFETDLRFVEFSEILDRVFGSRVTYLHNVDFRDVLPGMARIKVLSCLSVLHHWLKYDMENQYIDAVKLFRARADNVLIDCATPEEDARIKSKTIPLDWDQHALWLRDSIGFSSVERLGEHEKRALYLCRS